MRPVRRGAARHAGDAGFTLVEVLVAFAIVSLVSLMVIRIAADMAVGGRRIETAAIRLDEAEGIVLVRAAAGSLRPGLEQGRFGDGQPWTLTVVDARPVLGWRDLPPLWRVRLTLDRPDGQLIYATLIAGGLGGV
ncbi:prepilin-type N-terminal cleavage/methylation domain-containing protein [Methylobacterium sp. JK268]